MNAALFGGICAVGLGSADFMGRFSSRAIGHHNALLGMLLASTVLVSLWMWAAGTQIVWDTHGLWLVAIHGAATTVMTLLLYWGLARGPISVVAPIVAAYPVLVLLFYFVFVPSVRGLYGLLEVISSKVETSWNRLAGLVGLCRRMAMILCLP